MYYINPKDIMASAKIPYEFPSENIKKNFKVEAAKRETSIVAMITSALKKEFPSLFKENK